MSIGKRKNGYRSKSKEVCVILGMKKTAKGKLKYLIRVEMENMEYSNFIDAWIMKSVYPQTVIEFYEKIMIWN